MLENNLTVVFYTANHIDESFASRVRERLLKAVGDLPLISVSQKPMDFGYNICVGDIGRSHLNIYRQALMGARNATTKYVAFCEDDVLYSPEHFHHIPKEGHFAYDKNIWVLYTFSRPPFFSYKDRVNFNGLICEKDLFIEAMLERFEKWPDDSVTPIRNWAEPSKYESHLGVTVRNQETYMAEAPSVALYHPTALSYLHLGTRKRQGINACEELAPWGRAEDLLKIYE